MGHYIRKRNNSARGRTSRIRAATRRQNKATKSRRTAAAKRRALEKTRRNQRAADKRLNRYLQAMKDPYGRHGQKLDEVSYY